MRGEHATTAGGEKLHNKGRVEIDGTVDDKPFPMHFKNMEVKLQILSVRKMVKIKNDAHVVLEGGWNLHRDTGRVIKL